MIEKEIICANCGKPHIIDAAEYKWQTARGRVNFFCSGKCASIYNNAKRKKPVIQKLCEYCGQPFDCYTPYTKRFCSRECASAGSVTAKRLEGNRRGGLNSSTSFSIYSAQRGLKQREAWKYAEMKQLLDGLGIEHEFEFLLDERYIFDLCFPQWRLLVEFDSKYHQDAKQQEIDADKAQCAQSNGYELVRITTPYNTVISAAELAPIISKHVTVK